MNLQLRTRGVSNLTKSLLFFALAVVIVVFSSYPVFFAFFSSLKPNYETFIMPPRLLPQEWTLDAYAKIFSTDVYLKYFRNSWIISTGATAITLGVATLAAYGFSRFPFPAKQGVLVAIMMLQMFPGVILMTPYYRIAQDIGIYDTYIVLILINSAFRVPIAIWLLKNFFDTIPVSLEQSAMVDGATRLQAILYIFVPLMKPGIIAVGIMAFLRAWNEFMFALLLTTGPATSPITFGLADLFTQFNIERNVVMAVTMLSVVPLFLIFILLQKSFVRGILGGFQK